MSANGGRKKRAKREHTDGTHQDQSDDQSFNQRRVLRSGYRSIQTYIRDKTDEIAASSSKEFISIIKEVDGMHKQVDKPREQVSDAGALRDLANTLVTSIKVHNIGSVTPSLFVSSLITKYGKRGRGRRGITGIKWKDIGMHVSPLFMTFPRSFTMLGRMNLDIKPPKVLGKRKRSRLKEEKMKPEEIKDTSEEMTDTDRIIATIFDILKTKKKVCLENIVLNRNSFAQTVENLFALSFLVKDGRVVITVDDKCHHHVSPRNAPSASMISSRKVEYSHFMFRFDFNDWKLMKDLVGEGSELMPHRTKVNSSGGCEPEPDKDLDPTTLNEQPTEPRIWKCYVRRNNTRDTSTIITIKKVLRTQEGSHELGSEPRPICV